MIGPGNQCQRDSKAERLGRFEIDRQFVLGRCLPPTYALRSDSSPDLEAPQIILTERRQFRNHYKQAVSALGQKHIPAESAIR